VERHRKKWNRVAKAWYLVSEWLATWCCSAIVSDAQRIREYYLEHYGKESTFIPYGAEVGHIERTDLIRALGLEPRKYVLYVSRMEPENNALMVRLAFEKVRTDFKLVLVGDAPYAVDYIQQVKATRDPRILIPGGIYGECYRQLQSHCHTYVQATEVGGTHPALIEAMGRGALVLYLDTPVSAEVTGEAAIPFKDDLVAKLQWAVDICERERAAWGCRAMQRVEQHYSWNAVTDAYEALFRRLIA
jgi:glycosyltransferase involved in cell wall biosynthesis